jgi:hypothetical protein
MLTGQVTPSTNGGVGNVKASRFASEDVIALEYRNRESSLDQLMRGAKAANTTTENCNLTRHHRLATRLRFTSLMELG